MSGVAGCVHPIGFKEDAGVELVFCPGSEIFKAIELTTPLAPGVLTNVSLSEYRVLGLGESVQRTIQGVLAFDGERERIVKEERIVRFVIERNGPKVVNIERTLDQAAKGGLFKSD